MNFTGWQRGWVLLTLGIGFSTPAGASDFAVLKPARFAAYVQRFNGMEDENVTNSIPNAKSWSWLRDNIPLFECPDKEVEETYYFRWWSYRKHLVKSPEGWVQTEFLGPMKHAGAYNTISCAVGHHLQEGRWLRDHRYLDDYTRFWLHGDHGKPEPHFHKYSSWFAAAVYDRYLATGERDFTVQLLPELVADYQAWEQDQQITNGPLQGLFWSYDVRDGMEESISGGRHDKNARPTLNSYMYGNARAIAALARLAGQPQRAQEFEAKAATLRQLVLTKLWNPQAGFFEVTHPSGLSAEVREEVGFIPWRFELPPQGYEQAWAQLTDLQGFCAPWGITTAERRHPAFRSHGCCKCEWDGAIWPFGTSQTLEALANVLRDYTNAPVSATDYFDAFRTYARSLHYEGKPYVGEYLDETTGQWLKGRQERSRYYNHSTFADALITGVVGLRPRPDKTVTVEPLVPAGAWDWFCLDGVPYHGQALTILWDKDGTHYRRGQGLSLLVKGKVVGHAESLSKLTATLR